MIQMFMNKFFLFVLVLFTATSCSKNETVGVEIVPPKALGIVESENDLDIKAFLETHFYNYESFENPPNGFDFKVRVDTIAGENLSKTPLSLMMQSEIISISSDFFGLETKETVDHTFYYLVVREGASGISPTVGDSTLLKYQGSFLNGKSFDASATFVWQYLPFTIRGYQLGTSKLKAGLNVVSHPDGTTSFSDSGIGLFVFPSALAYYNSSSGSIPAYEPLVFSVELGKYIKDTDFDNDGIPSIMEDLNGDGIFSNDNTDSLEEARTFQQAVANHADSDDDGDGIPTREEIVFNADGSISFPDSDGDGIPDYLDKD
jgi:FKBP-type peptidyl-prolyl cis-trans isomerase FkpA